MIFVSEMLLFVMRRKMVVFGEKVMIFGGGRKMMRMVFVDREMGVFFDRERMRLFWEMVIFLRSGGGGGEMVLHAGVVKVLLGVVQMQIPVHRRRREHRGGVARNGNFF